MLENKKQEKIAGIISDFFDGQVTEADIDILAIKIYEKYVAELEQDLEFTTKTANDLIEIKHKLEQELAELKEKAIVPKFKIGQEVFIVDKNYFKIEHYKIANCKILGIEDKLDRKNNYVRWYILKIYNSSYFEYRRYKFKEKDVFATEQEAQAKLQELQNGDFSGE